MPNTVGRQKIAHALRSVQNGDITITDHRWTTRAGADINDAVCWAEDHYYLTGDGTPQLTEAAEKWLALQPPAPTAPVFLAGPEVP